MGHLILNRRPGEGAYLRLPDSREIHVRIGWNRAGSTTLDIEAPADVVIMRDELHGLLKEQATREQNQ